MIKQQFIEPFKKYPELVSFNAAKTVSFLESVEEEELKKIGLAIFVLYSPPMLKKVSEWYNNATDCSFREELIDCYSLHRVLSSRDKKIGNYLSDYLIKTQNPTAKEFLGRLNYI